LFRQQIQQATKLGQLAALFIDGGNLVPDHIVVELVRESLGDAQYQTGCLLDGFPRAVAQAQALDALVREHGKRISMVLALDVPQEILVDRLLQRRRKDDTLDTIQQRLDVYLQETQPVLNYYQQQELVVTIDGNGTVEDVFQRIKQATDLQRAKTL
jgi:adenylate kinase